MSLKEIYQAVHVDESKQTALKLPQEFPFVLLVASGMFYIQQKAKSYLMKRQAQIMGKENYMKPFVYQHELAFDTTKNKG